MAVETTYTHLRQNLATTLDQVTEDQEIVIVRRREKRSPGKSGTGSRDVALVPAEELAGLIETAHLLRSPKNSERLLKAMRRVERQAGKGIPAAEAIQALRRDGGLEPV